MVARVNKDMKLVKFEIGEEVDGELVWTDICSIRQLEITYKDPDYFRKHHMQNWPEVFHPQDFKQKLLNGTAVKTDISDHGN